MSESNLIKSTWQGRLMQEREDLRDKAAKLDAFVGSETFDALGAELQSWIFIQAKAMQMYSEALDARISVL